LESLSKAEVMDLLVNKQNQLMEGDNDLDTEL
jgi:hypothetical protein